MSFDGWPRRVAASISYGALGLLLILNVVYLTHYAVDIAYYDDWDQFFLLDGATLGELFVAHNEHHVLLSRLQLLFLFHLDGWDLYVQQMMNLGIYLAGVVWLTRFLTLRSGLPGPVVALFTLLLLSPRIHENHLWGFQGQFHFAWMLDLLCVALLFGARGGWSRALGAATCAAFAIWSFAAGMVGAAAIAAAYPVFLAIRAARRAVSRASAVSCALVFFVPTAIGIGVWVASFDTPPGGTPPVPPTDPRVWAFWLSLISHAFALETQSIAVGLACLGIVVLPLLLLPKRILDGDPDAWSLTMAIGCVLAMLAGISLGRGGDPIISKSSRYAELAALLVPLAAAAWGAALRGRPFGQGLAVVALALVAGAGYRDEWNFRKFYEPTTQSRLAGLACVERYHYAGGDGVCPDLWWESESMAPMLERARELELSYYRKLRARRGEAAPRSR